jgi:hypothetical protein
MRAAQAKAAAAEAAEAAALRQAMEAKAAASAAQGAAAQAVEESRAQAVAGKAAVLAAQVEAQAAKGAAVRPTSAEDKLADARARVAELEQSLKLAAAREKKLQEENARLAFMVPAMAPLPPDYFAKGGSRPPSSPRPSTREDRPPSASNQFPPWARAGVDPLDVRGHGLVSPPKGSPTPAAKGSSATPAPKGAMAESSSAAARAAALKEAEAKVPPAGILGPAPPGTYTDGLFNQTPWGVRQPNTARADVGALLPADAPLPVAPGSLSARDRPTSRGGPGGPVPPPRRPTGLGGANAPVRRANMQKSQELAAIHSGVDAIGMTRAWQYTDEPPGPPERPRKFP